MRRLNAMYGPEEPYYVKRIVIEWNISIK
jgi:hypothetical protein